MTLINARWQDVALPTASTAGAVVITDPPYSKRTHAAPKKTKRASFDSGKINPITYHSLTGDDCKKFVEVFLCKLAPEWWVIFGDNDTSSAWRSALEMCDQYVFAPVVWVKTDAIPRLAGDGPQSSVEWITIARPRKKVRRSGSRPGHYITQSARHEQADTNFVGKKPLDLMRALVRDYSEPGQLVVDPYAGTGTTLLAAAIEGREHWGAEVAPATFEIARRRITSGHTPQLNF